MLVCVRGLLSWLVLFALVSIAQRFLPHCRPSAHSFSSIGNSGKKIVAGVNCTNLQTLALAGTEITNDSLHHCALNLKQLTDLDVSGAVDGEVLAGLRNFGQHAWRVEMGEDGGGWGGWLLSWSLVFFVSRSGDILCDVVAGWP